MGIGLQEGDRSKKPSFWTLYFARSSAHSFLFFVSVIPKPFFVSISLFLDVFLVVVVTLHLSLTVFIPSLSVLSSFEISQPPRIVLFSRD